MIVVILIGLSYLSMKRTADKASRAFSELCQKQYGKYGRHTLTTEEERALKAYSERRSSPGQIDDITWHDLEGGRLYGMLNTCVSTCGDAVLYDKMRHPLFDETKIQDFEAVASHMAEHKEARLTILKALAMIGRPRKGIGIEALDELEKIEDLGVVKYMVLAAATLADIVLVFVMPLAATIIFIILMIVNIFLTLSLRDKTGQAQDGIRLILSLQKAGETLISEKLTVPGEGLTIIKAETERLRYFKKGAFFVTGRAQVSESLGSAILTYVNLFLHLDLIKFAAMVKAYKADKAHIMALYEALGEWDAAAAVASFEKALPVACKPEFTENEAVALSVTNLIHPFVRRPVGNSVVLKGGTLMTGANASGKSTFLKSCALAAWLAQTVGVVPASSYKAPLIRVMTSMALSDDLTAGASYFVVEIRSLKRILDASKETIPLLGIVDEVLRGTNTIERIAASTQILKGLKNEHTLILAATHDRELTEILADDYINRHFEETITDEGIVFTYKLMDGEASTRNAIALLEAEGYDKGIVSGAKAMAGTFEREGAWIG